MTGYHGDLVGVVEGQVSIDEDAEVGDCGGKTESLSK